MQSKVLSLTSALAIGTSMAVPYLVGRIVRVTDNNKSSLLMIHVWSVGLF